MPVGRWNYMVISPVIEGKRPLGDSLCLFNDTNFQKKDSGKKIVIALGCILVLWGCNKQSASKPAAVSSEFNYIKTTINGSLYEGNNFV